MIVEEAGVAPALHSLSGLISIGKMARRAGLSLSTMRYYTVSGLLPFITTEGGHKRFHEKTVLRRLSRIRHLAEQGWSLRQIQDEFIRHPMKRRVLLIDENPVAGEVFLKALHGIMGLEVYIANNYFSAGRLAGIYAPDVLILHMPKIEPRCAEICRAVRQDSSFSQTRILVYADDNRDGDQIMSLGANRIMEGPFQADEFSDVVRSLLE
ncbi:MAG: MerR family transcriptional regulator [Elusimicrobia bacterium]|nr:MerR family transcriptional regulator [Elusimicrobiota bacterium]